MKYLLKKTSDLIKALLLSLMFISGLLANDTVEDFTFLDLQDIEHQYSEYAGQWIIVNYWATYCGPCLEEIPDLIEFNKNNQDRAVILGFEAGGSSLEQLKAFSIDNKINYLIAPMQAETMMAFGVITAIPTSFIISPDGKIVAKVIGVLDVSKIEKLMDYYGKLK